MNGADRHTNSLLYELERLQKAGETGNFDITINENHLQKEETQAARLLNNIIKKYKDSVEYNLMKYRLASDALGVALWDMDIEGADPLNPNNKFTCSQEFRNMLGFSGTHDFPNTLQSWTSRLHPQDKETALNAFAAHLADYSGKTPYDIEYRLMLKNGDYRYFRSVGTTLRGNAGVPLRVAGAIMDITEKKLMAKALERRNYLLDTVNNVASILLQSGIDNFASDLYRCMGLIAKAVDVDFMAIWKNEREGNEAYSHQIFKWVDGINYDEIILPENNAGTWQIISEKSLRIYDNTFPDFGDALSKGNCINSRVCDMSKKEQKFFSSFGIRAIFIVPVFIQDQFWGFISYNNYHDERLFTESEQTVMRSCCLVIAHALLQNSMMLNLKSSAVQLEKTLKDVKKANSAKSDFLANMSHEMRTPLNAVIGLSTLSLEDSSLCEETRSNIEKINNSGMTLLGLVNDILDISKIESGQMEFVEIEYDIPSLVNDTVTQNILRINEKPVEFKLDIDENMFTFLCGDELRVKQIINNLLSNAIKYTDKGMVELSLRSIREEGTVWLVIKVRDTGRGIKKEDIGRLFLNYAQFDLESNRKIEGTGLGLPITRELTERMGGNITVESEYGKGSVFTVRIMQKFVNDTKIGPQVVKNLKKFRYTDSRHERLAQFKRISLPYARVLVVDDNLTNLEVAKGLMKPYKMEIDCVDSGQEAVDVIRNAKVKYNAVFMDHMMPGMNGIEAVRLIRETDTDYAKNLPIIALTANAIVGNEEMFLNHGFQAFLTKPIDVSRLDKVIRNWVRGTEKNSLDNGEESSDGSDADSQSQPEAPGLVKKIAGLGLDKGLEHLGGNEGLYLKILRSYAASTRSLLGLIENVSIEKLAGYAIAVHGIRGASLNIFADQVSSLAGELEKAAKSADFEYIRRHNGVFLETAWKLVRDIEEMLAGMEKNG